jgi:hypothetical protein
LLLRILSAVLVLGSLAGASSFDAPRSKKTVDLGPSASGADTHIKVNCYFYSTFMIKEVDLGEKGADRLAVVPITSEIMPECTRAQAKTEKVINSDEWTGYFKGVKNNLVFFDADDGVNGGLGFAVYDPRTGKKIFDDSALGNLDFLDAPAGKVLLRYTRVLETMCVVPKDPDCWSQIQKTTGLVNAPAPDCRKGYETSAQQMAKGRCQAQGADNEQCLAKEIKLARDQAGGAPSVIVYPVEVMLDRENATRTIKPLEGEIQCWPSD